jgi:hypothetical protein
MDEVVERLTDASLEVYKKLILGRYLRFTTEDHIHSEEI